MRPPLVAVVGGGASGTLTAVHLLRLAHRRRTPLRVLLIDRYGRHGLGQAYATEDPAHLLNACAAKMSALHDEPGHLLDWARGNGLRLSADDYLPRRDYGRYLRDLLHATEAETRRTAELTRITATVTALTRTDARRGRTLLELADGGAIDADVVVLATGNRPSTRLPVITPGPRYIAEPWAPGALRTLGGGSPILVVGTGLTMVDVAVTATADPRTVVYALSRHGLLPRPHRPGPVPPPQTPPYEPPAGPIRLRDLLRAVRAAAAQPGVDWRAVVDGLRPHIPEIWSGLTVDDKRRFLTFVARYWEIHRHRIPPRTAERVAALRAEGRLQVIRGHLISAVPAVSTIVARVATADGDVRELRVGRLVNATGPAHDVTADPLLADLVATGLARPDPLRMGLDVTESSALRDAAGEPYETVFTLGPTLRGRWYETTAIPEIRAQAAALAPRVLHAAHRAATAGQAVPPAYRLRRGAV